MLFRCNWGPAEQEAKSKELLINELQCFCSGVRVGGGLNVVLV